MDTNIKDESEFRSGVKYALTGLVIGAVSGLAIKAGIESYIIRTDFSQAASNALSYGGYIAYTLAVSGFSSHMGVLKARTKNYSRRLNEHVNLGREKINQVMGANRPAILGRGIAPKDQNKNPKKETQRVPKPGSGPSPWYSGK